MEGLGRFSQRVSGGVVRRFRNMRQRLALQRAKRVLSGQAVVTLADDQCCAVVLEKNARWYLPELLRHHRAIGVQHFLVIDNGSTDGTPELLESEPDVTVIQACVPVSDYEVLMRRLLPPLVVQGGWFLVVDSDEMFEPPPGCNGQIRPLLRYMLAEGQTAMLVHMLDMFSDQSAEITCRWSYVEALDRMSLYSLNALERIDYHDPDFILAYFVKDNPTAAPQNFWRGGMRYEVFGETPLLTKHGIFRNADGVAPPGHVHAVSNVRVSDVSACYRHYKFSGDYITRERNHVAAGTWQHGEDVLRLARYDQPGAFAIRTASQLSFRGTEVLLDEGFIQTSDRFREFVERQA